MSEFKTDTGFTFVAKDLSRSVSSVVQRRAVLDPLFPTSKRLGIEGASNCLYELRKLWMNHIHPDEMDRIVTASKLSADTERLTPQAIKLRKKAPFMMNCPPFGVKLKDFSRVRTCRMHQFCPFCFARRTEKTYKALDKFFYPESRRKLVATAADVVLIQLEKFSEESPFEVVGRANMAGFIKQQLGEAYILGAASRFSIEPKIVRAEKRTGYLAKMSALVVVEGNKLRPDLLPLEDGDLRIRVSQLPYSLVKRRKLSGMVAGFHRYPLGLLRFKIENDPTTTKLMWLTAVAALKEKRRRWYETSGVLRPKRENPISANGISREDRRALRRARQHLQKVSEIFKFLGDRL